MKLSHFKILLIAPSMLLTACGYGLKEVYNGIPYNSTVFQENYFNVWNDKINPNKEGSKITETKDAVALSLEEHKVFTKISDVNFRNCDDEWASYAYEYDKDNKPKDASLKPYGPAVAMTKLDDSFKYGIVSKLFDGQMFCNGDFQKSRTQVEPLNQGQGKGFGVLLSKETNDTSYFMMNFKCSVVYEDNQELGKFYTDMNLKLGLYMKNDNGYSYLPLTYSVEKAPTNSGDGNRSENYVCFGFSLEKFDTKRLIGFSIQYEYGSFYTKDNENNYHPYTFPQDFMHAMMLYEVSFPKTKWH